MVGFVRRLSVVDWFGMTYLRGKRGHVLKILIRIHGQRQYNRSTELLKSLDYFASMAYGLPYCGRLRIEAYMCRSTRQQSEGRFPRLRKDWLWEVGWPGSRYGAMHFLSLSGPIYEHSCEHPIYWTKASRLVRKSSIWWSCGHTL